MMKKRLLLMSEPGKDGVFAYVHSLIRYLHANHPEIEVDFLYSSLRGSRALDEAVAEVKAHGGEAIDLKIGNSPQLLDFAALRKIWEVVARRKPSWVHAHSSKAGALARIAALWPGFPPVLYSPHAYFGMPKLGGVKEKIFNGVETFLGRIGATHNCSEDERDFARDVLGVNPASLNLIHNGIDTERFAPVSLMEKRECRRQLGLPEHGKLLVTVGRDSVQKNYGPLYEALNTFLPGSGVTFAHAGNGSVELRESLSPAARESAFAFHYLDNPETLLHAADGFILTSRYEGLSLSMLQALSCGVAPILTDAPGLRVLRLLGFSVVRWLTNPAQVDEIVVVLGGWLNEPPLSVIAERDLACRYFTERTQLAAMVELYGRLK